MLVRTGEATPRRPQAVIAHSDPAYVAGVARAFRRYGWAVAVAADGAEVRRLTAALSADLVVLAADLPGESGWLTCAKLSLGRPRPPVVLIAAEENGRDAELAAFAGAARLVRRDEGADALLEEAGVAVAV
jgi:DNA-binding response OmpR family regulator